MLHAIDECLFNGLSAEPGDEMAVRCAGRCAALAAGIGLMAAVDGWLAVHLAQSFGAVLADAPPAVIPAMAAAGWAAMTGASLLLTVMLLGDLRDSLPRNSVTPGH